jgi:hypothetical protein
VKSNNLQASVKWPRNIFGKRECVSFEENSGKNAWEKKGFYIIEIHPE